MIFSYHAPASGLSAADFYLKKHKIVTKGGGGGRRIDQRLENWQKLVLDSESLVSLFIGNYLELNPIKVPE